MLQVLVALVLGISPAMAQSCDGRLFSHDALAAPVCVPEDPQRIVVLDPQLSLGMLFELEAPVLATPQTGVQDGWIRRMADAGGVLDIGHPLQPSLERLVALKPDLIIGDTAMHGGLQPALERIAPVVLIAPVNWQEQFRLLADLTNRRDRAGALLSDYQERVQAIRARVPPDQTVSVVRIGPDRFQVYLDGPGAYAPYAVLAEAGVKRSAYETTGGDEVLKRPGWEEIAALDGDVLLYVVVSGYDPAPDDALADATLANPFWQMLPAVAAGRAWRVGRGPWMGFHGVSSAMDVLDDIERFILP
ncbi:iron-siderophore ABC transporter substrate-binding protein [Xinfangfangia sp. D13-10-4-6]|nr:iron-siderophore ABC transporter substrate-binding protein [Pseudogemmobacter hezensis]